MAPRARVRVRMLPATEVELAEPIWVELERRVGAGRLAISWRWTSTWLRYFGDCVRSRFAVVERGCEPIGIVLLVTSRRGPSAFPLRRLHLGTAGEPPGETVYAEYNDLLCHPDDREDVARAVVNAVRDLPGWDEFDIEGFHPDAAKALGSGMPLTVREDKSWTIRLTSDRPVQAALSSSTRRLVRQARESLQPGEPEMADSPAAAADIMAELAELHQLRWTALGKPGVFGSRRLSGFLTDIADAWVPEGRAALYRLRGAEGTLGCVLGFIEADRFLYYQAGIRQFDENRKRAGLLCHAVFAEHCRERGLAEYELLAGDAQFKRQLSGGEFNTLVWAYHGRRSVRGTAVTLARAARQALTERRAA